MQWLPKSVAIVCLRTLESLSKNYLSSTDKPIAETIR